VRYARKMIEAEVRGIDPAALADSDRRLRTLLDG
jgi:hypothetical protein